MRREPKWARALDLIKHRSLHYAKNFLGVSSRKLARAEGVSYVHMLRVSNGKSACPRCRLATANALGVDAQEIWPDFDPAADMMVHIMSGERLEGLPPTVNDIALAQAGGHWLLD